MLRIPTDVEVEKTTPPAVQVDLTIVDRPVFAVIASEIALAVPEAVATRVQSVP